MNSQKLLYDAIADFQKRYQPEEGVKTPPLVAENGQKFCPTNKEHDLVKNRRLVIGMRQDGEYSKPRVVRRGSRVYTLARPVIRTLSCPVASCGYWYPDLQVPA